MATATVPTTVNNLIKLLEEFEELAVECDTEPCDINPFRAQFTTENKPRAQELREMINSFACDLLIDEEGRPNHDTMKTLRDMSDFYAICLESDRYGWVVGGLVTSRGVVVFG